MPSDMIVSRWSIPIIVASSNKVRSGQSTASLDFRVSSPVLDIRSYPRGWSALGKQWSAAIARLFQRHNINRNPKDYGAELTAVQSILANPRKFRVHDFFWPARANPACASGILFESILRSNGARNGFHTAKAESGDGPPDRCYRRKGWQADIRASLVDDLWGLTKGNYHLDKTCARR
jgi:hypothetical protein